MTFPAEMRIGSLEILAGLAIFGVVVGRHRFAAVPPGPEHIIVQLSVDGRAMEMEIDLESALRELLGVGSELAQWLRAPALDQLDVTFDRAGHRDAQRAGIGEVLPRLSFFQVHAGRGFGGAGLAKIEDVHLPIAGRVDEREAAAGESGVLGLGYREGEGRRHRRIDGISTATQDGRAGLGREWIRSRDRAAR